MGYTPAGHPATITSSGQPLRWETTDVGSRIVGEGGGGVTPGDEDDGRSFAIPEPAPPLPRP